LERERLALPPSNVTNNTRARGSSSNEVLGLIFRQEERETPVIQPKRKVSGVMAGIISGIEATFKGSSALQKKRRLTCGSTDEESESTEHVSKVVSSDQSLAVINSSTETAVTPSLLANSSNEKTVTTSEESGVQAASPRETDATALLEEQPVEKEIEIIDLVSSSDEDESDNDNGMAMSMDDDDNGDDDDDVDDESQASKSTSARTTNAAQVGEANTPESDESKEQNIDDADEEKGHDDEPLVSKKLTFSFRKVNSPQKGKMQNIPIDRVIRKELFSNDNMDVSDEEDKLMDGELLPLNGSKKEEEGIDPQSVICWSCEISLASQQESTTHLFIHSHPLLQ